MRLPPLVVALVVLAAACKPPAPKDLEYDITIQNDLAGLPVRIFIDGEQIYEGAESRPRVVRRFPILAPDANVRKVTAQVLSPDGWVSANLQDEDYTGPSDEAYAIEHKESVRLGIKIGGGGFDAKPLGFTTRTLYVHDPSRSAKRVKIGQITRDLVPIEGLELPLYSAWYPAPAKPENATLELDGKPMGTVPLASESRPLLIVDPSGKRCYRIREVVYAMTQWANPPPPPPKVKTPPAHPFCSNARRFIRFRACRRISFAIHRERSRPPDSIPSPRRSSPRTIRARQRGGRRKRRPRPSCRQSRWCAEQYTVFDSMTRSHLRLGTLFGIPIGLNVSWLAVFALVVWTLATGYFPQVAPEVPPTVLWATSMMAALLFFASILAHELGHALTAQLCGIPCRSITLFALGGVSRIASEPRNAREELLIAIAGPAVSVALAVGFWMTAFAAPQSTLWISITAYLTMVNAALAVFNMLPALPLDGGRVMRAVLWKVSGDPWAATRWSAYAGRFCGLSLASLGIVTGMFGGIMFAFWAVLIGLFIDRSAKTSFAAAREADDGLRGVVQPAPGLIPAGAALTLGQEVVYVDVDEQEHRELCERVAEWRARLDTLPRPGEIGESAPDGYTDDRMEMFRLLNDVDVKILSRLSRADIEQDFAHLDSLYGAWIERGQDAIEDTTPGGIDAEV